MRACELAVDDAERVRGGERRADLVGDRQRLVERERAALVEQRLQRAAGDPLDDEERPAVGELAGLEDLGDVRVAQPIERRQVAADGAHQGRDRPRPQQLQRDRPSGHDVARAMNRHVRQTRADVLDFVGADARAARRARV